MDAEDEDYDNFYLLVCVLNINILFYTNPVICLLHVLLHLIDSYIKISPGDRKSKKPHVACNVWCNITDTHQLDLGCLQLLPVKDKCSSGLS